MVLTGLTFILIPFLGVAHFVDFVDGRYYPTLN